MTAITPSFATVPAAASAGSRRGAGDSSGAFGRSLAAASDEAAATTGPQEVGDASSPTEVSPGVVGTLPDGVAHPGLPGLPGSVAGEAIVGSLPGGLEDTAQAVPEPGLGADAPVGPGGVEVGADGPGTEGTGGSDGQGVVGVPPVPVPVVGLPGTAVLPGSDVPSAAGPDGAPLAVGLPSAGSEEQAAVPVPPADEAALPAGSGGAEQGVGQGGAPGAQGPTATTGTGVPADQAAPGAGSTPLVATGQTPGGGAGDPSGTARQPSEGSSATPVDGASRGPLPAAAPASGTGAAAPAAPAPEPPGAPAQVVPVPVPVVQTPVSAAVGQVVPAAPAPQAAPTLHAQVSGPVFQLVGAGDGDHVLTLSVTPENLGPVTVRAHIAGGELRIELFAPQDAGREALRALAGELRRDLAGIAPSASLSVSDADQAPAQGGAGHAGQDAAGRRAPEQPWAARPDLRPGNQRLPTDQTTQPTVDDRTPGAARRLDVLV